MCVIHFIYVCMCVRAGVSSGGQADVMEDTSTYSFRPSVGGPVPPTAGEPSSALSAKPQSPSTAAAAAGGGALPSLPPGVSSRVRSMSSKELKEVFKAALEYSRPLLQAPSAPAPPSSGTVLLARIHCLFGDSLSCTRFFDGFDDRRAVSRFCFF